jgi:Fe-S cluster assembly ATP-binding protein
MALETQPILEIKNLQANVEGKTILKDVNLTINRGEVHAIMGPNGSGKSTLAFTLMGHPNYEVTGGSVLFNGQDLFALNPNERAKAGMFLAFQYPTAIPGVTIVNFLRTSLKALRGHDIPAKEFRQELRARMKDLQIDESFVSRYVNDGFSGGEKKRFEAMQMSLMKPVLAILDETDSGLDIDALRIVAENANNMMTPDQSILLITHYQRLLNYIKPDFVHVFVDGRIVLSGDKELALTLEDRGYDWLVKEVEQEALQNG